MWLNSHMQDVIQFQPVMLKNFADNMFLKSNFIVYNPFPKLFFTHLQLIMKQISERVFSICTSTFNR